jgi:hypothetical protein
MESIILVCGGDKKVVENYTPKSLKQLEPSPAAPFWLDLPCPSERLLRRISVPFRFDPRSLRACLSLHCSPGCEDFRNYLFIETSLLEPSDKSIFVRSDLKIFLSREYLVTIHGRRTPLCRLFPALRDSPFSRPGELLLRIFDESISALMKSPSPRVREQKYSARSGGQPNKDPLWWRLRNFRAALLGDFKIMHEMLFVGAWPFGPDDRALFNSIKAKISALCDMTAEVLQQEDSAGSVHDSKKEKVS